MRDEIVLLIQRLQQPLRLLDDDERSLRRRLWRLHFRHDDLRPRSERLTGIERTQQRHAEEIGLEGTKYSLARVRWAARHEQVLHLDDIMLRRTRLGLITPHGGKALLPKIHPVCREELERLGRPAGPEILLECPAPADAWSAARSTATDSELICIAGSVFIAAELRALTSADATGATARG